MNPVRFPASMRRGMFSGVPGGGGVRVGAVSPPSRKNASAFRSPGVTNPMIRADSDVTRNACGVPRGIAATEPGPTMFLHACQMDHDFAVEEVDGLVVHRVHVQRSGLAPAHGVLAEEEDPPGLFTRDLEREQTSSEPDELSRVWLHH